MDTLVDRCAGIDISKRDVKVCVRVPGARQGTFTRQVRSFTSFTSGLSQAAQWLDSQGVTLVGMESTGEYWKPVYYLLEAQLPGVELALINPQHIKAVPGRKSDVSDAQWIADLVAHGLVRSSFVPPAPIRVLRDLTRARSTLVHDHTRVVQRVADALEGTGVKLSAVVSDVVGKSSRAMLELLIAGQRDPQVLADVAIGRMRAKTSALIEALTMLAGHFTDHHAFMLRQLLDQVDHLQAMIARFDARIEAEIAPFRGQLDLIQTIPGVGVRGSQIVIAETGGDMSRFPTPGHLASWSGLCPGLNESAGKNHSGRTRPGNNWLAGAMGTCAAAAARTHGTYLSAKYDRLARRRGKKRALVAVARTQLESVWHVLTGNCPYQDLGSEHFTRNTHPSARRNQNMINELAAQGYKITPPTAA